MSSTSSLAEATPGCARPCRASRPLPGRAHALPAGGPHGQDQVAEPLARHGASTALSSADEFLAACRRAAATAALAAPDLAAQLTAQDHQILTSTASHGHAEAVRLMLDLGFPPGTRSEQDDGATALHLEPAPPQATNRRPPGCRQARAWHAWRQPREETAQGEPCAVWPVTVVAGYR